jgi:DnaJ family protein C protein 7
MQLGKLKESVEDCTSALQLDEHYVKAVIRRANSYMELEQFEEAVRDFELAHRLDKSNMEYRRMLQHAKVELKKSKRKDYYKVQHSSLHFDEKCQR